MKCINHRRRKGGGARGLKPPLGLLRGGLAPLRMISHRNYLSWSGAENRDKDRDTLRPMKLDYQFLAQIFENLMRAGGYYSLFIIFPKAQHTSKHEDFCQKTVRLLLH